MELSAKSEELGPRRIGCSRSLDECGGTDSSVEVEKMRPMLCRELQLFSVVEVADLLGIGRSKVYELLYKGELKSVKIGGSRRIRYIDLGEYLRYLDDGS